jgi:hypothetical protein
MNCGLGSSTNITLASLKLKETSGHVTNARRMFHGHVFFSLMTIQGPMGHTKVRSFYKIASRKKMRLSVWEYIKQKKLQDTVHHNKQ